MDCTPSARVGDRGQVADVSSRFGAPTMSERERQEALKRAAKRWVPRTRFIANTVPIPVMHWLVSHEEAIRVGGAIPPIPFDVAEWMADHVDNFAGGPQPQAVGSEEVEEVSEDTPGDYP